MKYKTLLSAISRKEISFLSLQKCELCKFEAFAIDTELTLGPFFIPSDDYQGESNTNFVSSSWNKAVLLQQKSLPDSAVLVTVTAAVNHVPVIFI